MQLIISHKAPETLKHLFCMLKPVLERSLVR